MPIPGGQDYDLELYGPDYLWAAGSYHPAGHDESIQHSAVAGEYYVRVLGIFAVSIKGEAGRSYRLETCDSLISGVWQPLATIVLTTSPRLYYDGDSIGQPVRFYRAVLVE